MARIVARFHQFRDQYNGPAMRQFVAELERVLSNVTVDATYARGEVTGPGTYAVEPSDNLILCDTTAGNVTIELGLPDTQLVLQKFEVNIKKDATPNVLYISPTGGAVTDYGTTTLRVVNKGTSLCFRAADDGWRIV